jgi:hypothetical protein
MATRGRHVDEEVVPILRVADASAAIAWYARLGFLKESEHRFAPGLPAFVTVARGSVRLFLSEHTGDAHGQHSACIPWNSVSFVRSICARDPCSTIADSSSIRCSANRWVS